MLSEKASEQNMKKDREIDVKLRPPNPPKLGRDLSQER